ncbi:MAG: hypothetical protein K2X69_00855 [Silvanigrellaceae bacterium]|nr:hypothetical protein [Silvanigrellaceae bacterium]
MSSANNFLIKAFLVSFLVMSCNNKEQNGNMSAPSNSSPTPSNSTPTIIAIPGPFSNEFELKKIKIDKSIVKFTNQMNQSSYTHFYESQKIKITNENENDIKFSLIKNAIFPEFNTAEYSQFYPSFEMSACKFNNKEINSLKKGESCEFIFTYTIKYGRPSKDKTLQKNLVLSIKDKGIINIPVLLYLPHIPYLSYVVEDEIKLYEVENEKLKQQFSDAHFKLQAIECKKKFPDNLIEQNNCIKNLYNTVSSEFKRELNKIIRDFKLNELGEGNWGIFHDNQNEKITGAIKIYGDNKYICDMDKSLSIYLMNTEKIRVESAIIYKNKRYQNINEVYLRYNNNGYLVKAIGDKTSEYFDHNCGSDAKK